MQQSVDFLPAAYARQKIDGQKSGQWPAINNGDNEMNAPTLLDDRSPGEPALLKAECKRFYDDISEQLNKTIFGEYAYFLNYGFVSNGAPELSVASIPKHSLNKNSVKLILELVADCPIDGRKMLDIGCGRGGTVSVLKQFFSPSSVVGLDLSPKAVEFCRRAHRDGTVSFYEGDAESLPFASHSFDVVTNVESSHSYPNVRRFYSEVCRVLVPGGHFLYTDVLSQTQSIEEIQHLVQNGFKLELERDITANVLLSCNEVASARAEAFEDSGSSSLRTFVGVPGSEIYEDLRTGKTKYGMWRFKKQL